MLGNLTVVESGKEPTENLDLLFLFAPEFETKDGTVKSHPNRID